MSARRVKHDKRSGKGMNRTIALLTLILIVSMSISVGFASGMPESRNAETEDDLVAIVSDISIDNVAKADIAQGIDTSERIKLSIFTADYTNMDQGNNFFTDYICDLLNIDLEFIYATSADYAQTLSLRIASGDYPGIIFNHGYTMAEQKLYGESGMLVNLYPLYDQYGYYSKKVYADYPTALQTVMQDSQTMYSLPSVNDCFHCTSTMKAWVYTPWLDALGLDKPATLDEFHDMLVAFRDNDLNGNGIADEISMAGSPSGWNTDVVDFIMNSFIYSAPFVDDDGNYVHPIIRDEYREGLRYIKSLYDEGLIHPESFTMNSEQLAQLGSSGDGVMVIGASFGGYTVFVNDISDPFGDWTNYETIAPLDGGGNGRVASHTPYGNYSPSFSITDKCEDVERAFLLADTLLCEDLTILHTTGKENVTWFRNNDESVKGINGETALYSLLTYQGSKYLPIPKDKPNQGWLDAGLMCRSSDYRLGEPFNEETRLGILEKILYDSTLNDYAPYLLSEQNLVPPLALSESEANEIALIRTSIDSYLLEMKAGFVTGLYDLDTYWETYLNALTQMGMDRYIEIHQNALDAKA